MCDRGSSFAHARLLCSGHEGPRPPELNQAMIKQALLEHWWPWLGRPRLLRADQGGCYSGNELQNWLGSQGIK
eukprot:2760396-Alexandrium_andersonii.AAC.1